jgi:hypothetical protein
MFQNTVCSIFIGGIRRKNNWDEIARVFIQIKILVSLFAKVLIADSFELLSHHFEDDVLALFRHVQTLHIFVLRDSSMNKLTW